MLAYISKSWLSLNKQVIIYGIVTVGQALKYSARSYTY